MNYNELMVRVSALQEEEFGLKLLDEITNVLSRNQYIYLNDMKRCLNSRGEYEKIVSVVKILLINKINELGLNISNIAVNNLVDSIISVSMIVDDVTIIDELVLLTGKNIFNPQGKEISRLFDGRLREITSREFVDFCKKNTYFNYPVGREVIRRIVTAINTKLKDFFKSTNDTLVNANGNILYNIPLVSIYSTMGLNNICNAIFNNEKAEFRLVVKHDIEDIYIFDILMNKDNILINEVTPEIYKLIDSKEKSLHK